MLRITVTKGGQFLDSWVEREAGFNLNRFIHEAHGRGYGLDIARVDFRRIDWHTFMAEKRGREYIDRASEPHIISEGGSNG